MKQNLQQRKLELIEKIISINDVNDLPELTMPKQKSGKSWFDKLSEREQKDIKEGLKDIEEGREMNYVDARKLINKWLSKK